MGIKKATTPKTTTKETTTKEETPLVNPAPQPVSLSAIVKEKKAEVLKANGGKRPLNPVARKSRALKALVKAMETRGFVGDGKGKYSLSGVEVNTTLAGFEVQVDNKYLLSLGKGAINELDSYMKLK